MCASTGRADQADNIGAERTTPCAARDPTRPEPAGPGGRARRARRSTAARLEPAGPGSAGGGTGARPGCLTRPSGPGPAGGGHAVDTRAEPLRPGFRPADASARDSPSRPAGSATRVAVIVMAPVRETCGERTRSSKDDTVAASPSGTEASTAPPTVRDSAPGGARRFPPGQHDPLGRSAAPGPPGDSPDRQVPVHPILPSAPRARRWHVGLPAADGEAPQRPARPAMALHRAHLDVRGDDAPRAPGRPGGRAGAEDPPQKWTFASTPAMIGTTPERMNAGRKQPIMGPTARTPTVRARSVR